MDDFTSHLQGSSHEDKVNAFLDAKLLKQYGYQIYFIKSATLHRDY